MSDHLSIVGIALDLYRLILQAHTIGSEGTIKASAGVKASCNQVQIHVMAGMLKDGLFT